MPAVAIAYDYEDVDDFDDMADIQKNINSQLTSSSSFQNHVFSHSPTNTITTSIRKVSSGGNGGAGSGGGRHKCPKCGMNVTFKHADL